VGLKKNRRECDARIENSFQKAYLLSFARKHREYIRRLDKDFSVLIAYFNAIAVITKTFDIAISAFATHSLHRAGFYDGL
jgi:hypothetical protein